MGHRLVTKTLLDALENKFTVDDGCWLWHASMDHGGYGRIRRDRRNLLAHRVVYELLVGPIPEGKHLDHLCRVRNCVRPDHLEAVDNRTNILRGEGVTALNARKTHCKRGHEFNDSNTYVIPSGRACRRCAIDRAARWKRANKKVGPS